MATPRKDPSDHLPKGRPSKYTESMCDTVVTCMCKGYIIEEVCAELGIHKDTFFEWVKLHPDFSDSYKKGKAGFNAFWARAYKKVMMGIPLTQPPKKKPKPKAGQKDTSAKDEEKEEEAVALGKANPAMMIFYMKAHCGWRETIVNKDKVEFTDSAVSDSTKERLSRIFGETKKTSKNIKPKIVTRRNTVKKGKNGE